MQILIGAGIVCAVLLIVAVKAIAHMVMQNLAPIVLAVVLGLPLVVLFVRALGKGMMHHTRVSWNVLPPAPARRQLPAPARTIEADDPLGRPAGAFSAEMTAAPQERPCEGPGCDEQLGEMTWTVEAVTEEEGVDPVTETRSFCSRDCADNYTRQEQDLQDARA
jgi:hypothetical protein